MPEIGEDRRAKSTKCPRDTRRVTGIAGETLAREYLEGSGYEILAQNYRSRYGEIDIIAARGDLTAFIEVKTRKGRSHGEPFEAVGPRKQGQIKRMALMWLAVNESRAASTTRSYRFDVISIRMEPSGPTISHLPDAFR